MKKEIYNNDYIVFEDGRTWSNITHKYIHGSIDSSGYVRVHLNINGKHKKVAVHRIVAKLFIPNPNNYDVVNHKDGNKLNNAAENLEWCTPSYNMQHAFEHNLVSKEHLYSPVRCLINNIWHNFKSIDDCAKFLNVTKQDIYKRVSNVRKNPSLKGKLKDIYFEYITN